MLSDLLRRYSAELAATFEGVRLPPALFGTEHDGKQGVSAGSGWRTTTEDTSAPLDLGDASTRVAILAGPHAAADVPGLHALAHHLGAPVANTWGAKGIYPWDDPHHMGTCGLQRDDFALLGFAAFDRILAIGIDAAESPHSRFALTAVVEGLPDCLDEILERSSPRPFHAAPNDLYTRIAAIAAPGYLDDSSPRHPARAVMDLKQSLAPVGRVTAQPGPAGLWVARTFPTDRLGSVIVPAQDRPGIAAAVGLLSAAAGTETVCVVHRDLDPVTRAIGEIAIRAALPFRVEVWGDDIDWARTDDLLAAAGPVVAWTE